MIVTPVKCEKSKYRQSEPVVLKDLSLAKIGALYSILSHIRKQDYDQPTSGMISRALTTRDMFEQMMLEFNIDQQYNAIFKVDDTVRYPSYQGMEEFVDYSKVELVIKDHDCLHFRLPSFNKGDMSYINIFKWMPDIVYLLQYHGYNTEAASANKVFTADTESVYYLVLSQYFNKCVEYLKNSINTDKKYLDTACYKILKAVDIYNSMPLSSEDKQFLDIYKETYLVE